MSRRYEASLEALLPIGGFTERLCGAIRPHPFKLLDVASPMNAEWYRVQDGTWWMDNPDVNYVYWALQLLVATHGFKLLQN